jgi:hypothetical protein
MRFYLPYNSRSFVIHLQILKIQGEETEPLPTPPSPARKPAAAKAPAGGEAAGGNNKRSGDRDRSSRPGPAPSSSRGPREASGAPRSGRRGEQGSSESKHKAHSSEPWGKEALPAVAENN